MMGNSSVRHHDDREEMTYEALLARIADWGRLTHYCQGRFRARNHAVRAARHEDIGLCVAKIYQLTEDEAEYDRFADQYEKDFGREPKPERLNREVFVHLYGEERKDLAGTDAMAMREAIERRVPAERIPEYIKRKGGTQRLLEAERARKKPWVMMELWVHQRALAELEMIDPGASLPVLARRSRRPGEQNQFAVIPTR